MTEDPAAPPLWRLQHRVESLEERVGRLEADSRERFTRLDADVRERFANIDREMEQRVHKNDFEPIRRGFWATISVLALSAGGALLSLVVRR
jgi:hypothetical protein